MQSKRIVVLRSGFEPLRVSWGRQTTFRPLENATYNPRDRERQLSRVSEKGV